jgi:predicted TIM-barrel fold metal-dependent hydrolase
MTAPVLSRKGLGYDLVDADNHYYEPYDCFTRYIDPDFSDRSINVRVDAKGRGRLFFGDRQFRYIRVIQTDYIGAPGSMRTMLDDKNSTEGFVHHDLIRGWDFPDMMQRGPRIAKMNEQGVQGGLMLGTMMLQAENELHDDVPALYANIRAYNRWLDDEWGFDRDGRILTAPMISLLDAEQAIVELDRVLALGAKAVVMKPGPLWGRSPVDPIYDGFWSRLQDSDARLVFHSTDPRYLAMLGVEFGESATPPVQGQTPFQWYLTAGKPVADTLASYVLNNLFGRFPRLKIVALECGINWVVPLLHDVDHAAHMGRKGHWPGGEVIGQPSEVLLDHLYVSPFYEEDVVGLVNDIGAEHVMFGSDYPHPEGVAEPIDFVKRLEGLNDGQIRMIMRDNAAGLFGITP